MIMSPGLNDVDVGPLGYDDEDVVQSCGRFTDYELFCSPIGREKSPCLPEARCRLPSVNVSRGVPQCMAAVALPPSPCNVPISGPLTKGPLPPLSPEVECCGDSGIVAGDVDDPDEHVLGGEGGDAGGPGSASNPGLCR